VPTAALTSAPTMSPTATPTAMPTSECPCYEEDSIYGQLWRDFVDGTIPGSSLRQCQTGNDEFNVMGVYLDSGSSLGEDLHQRI